MNGYEKMLKVMREQRSDTSAYAPKIATMLSEKTCTVSGLELDEEDLLVSASLKGKLEKGDEVVVFRISEEVYVILEKVVEI